MIDKIKKGFAVANMNCRDASVLLANSEEIELTRLERFGMWTHLLICGTCRRFRDQMRFLRRLLSVASKDSLEMGFSGSCCLSIERANQIKALLYRAAEQE